MKAIVDPRLSARVVATRQLVYTEPAREADRPPHVRAASGLAIDGERMFVIQDDAAFVAVVEREHVRAIALPPGPGGRRRFEDALGNKLDKLDLEGCYIEAGELVAFGSGSIEGVRDRVVRVRGDRIAVQESELYEVIRAAIGGPINIEGVVPFGDELWLFHRGNTGPGDRPAIVRVRDGAVRVERCDLGEAGGVAFGFTDAAIASGRVFVALAAEQSADAICDGPVLGARIGVIDGEAIRCAPFVVAGDRCAKIEGLAIGRRAWVAVDPDDVDVPAQLCEVELSGPW